MSVQSIIHLLSCTVEALTAFMLFDKFMDRRKKTANFIYIIGIAVLSIGIHISNKLFEYNFINLMTIPIVMFFISFLYQADIKTRIIFPIISIGISTCSEIIILFVLSLLVHTDKTTIYLTPSLNIMGTILSKLLNLAIVKLICTLSKRHKMNLDIYYWILYMTVFIVTLSTVYLIFSIPKDEEFLHISVFCAIGLMSSVLITLYLYEHMAMQTEKLREKELLERQYKDQVSHMEELMMAQEQINVYHDLQNHMLSLKAYMDKHNYEEGNNYLKKLIKQTDKYTDIIDTGNTVIDSIVTAKRNLAEKNGICFNARLQIPQNLLVDAADCCVILGNALDNAIEACEKLKGKKYIDMRMSYHDNALSCKIVNSAPEEYKNNKLLKTTKADSKFHGIGVKNIKKTLNKYRNIYRMEFEDGKFVFSFIIYDIETV